MVSPVKPFRLSLLVALLLTCAVPVLAQSKRPAPQRLPMTTSEGLQYDTCLERARKDPANAFEDALTWAARGGGDGAQHCAAVALVNMGHFEDAGDRLERLAQQMRTSPPALRAEVLAQSARAWLDGDEIEHAHAVIGAAIELAPRNAELYVDRAEILAAARNYWEAIDDLNKALDLDPNRVDALIFRASAYRFVDTIDLAFEDADRAVALAPTMAEAWLEHGIIMRLKGNDKGARYAWLQVLLLDPDGPAGDVARANIERMELKLDDKPAAGNAPLRPAKKR
jgi:tetratricopeptide (TPR) repeat protein